METYLKLILYWSIYFMIHSVFASDIMKSAFKRYFPSLNIYYRVIYNVFATVGILAIFILQSSFHQMYMYYTHTFITLLGLGIASLGLIVIKESFGHYDLREFLGLRQLSGNLAEPGFHRGGLLEYVRHPLYSGSMLLLIGYLIFVPGVLNLITVLCMIAYFIIGSGYEEKKLIKTFGKKYLDYKKEVPAFIPSLGIMLSKFRKSKK